MATWSYQDNWDLLPNINVKHWYRDGVLIQYELYPASGYVLHVPNLDEIVYDDDGNPTDEVIPYYTYGGGTELPDYDFATNPENYHADLYEEGMIVFGGGTGKPEVEVMSEDKTDSE